MGDELATSNVNRSYSNPVLFQTTLVVMGVATFSFVFASLYYYGSSLGSRIDDAERALYSRRGDRFWMVYVLFVIRYFPRVQTARGGRP
jgi:hypothetical protein